MDNDNDCCGLNGLCTRPAEHVGECWPTWTAPSAPEAGVARMAIRMCARCGFFAGKQHDCEALSEMVAAQTEAPGQGEPLAVLTHEVERLKAEVQRTAAIPSATARTGDPERRGDIARRALCTPGELATLIAAGQDAARASLRFRHNPSTGAFDPPTPAAMLGDAEALLDRACGLFRGAGRADLLQHAQHLMALALEAKREAEAREGRSLCANSTSGCFRYADTGPLCLVCAERAR